MSTGAIEWSNSSTSPVATRRLASPPPPSQVIRPSPRSRSAATSRAGSATGSPVTSTTVARSPTVARTASAAEAGQSTISRPGSTDSGNAWPDRFPLTVATARGARRGSV